MWLLFELGVFFARLAERSSARQDAQNDASGLRHRVTTDQFSRNVTGPSLTNATFMSAPNSPVATTAESLSHPLYEHLVQDVRA